MTGLEALQSVQNVTAHNARFAVINVEDWEALIEWLETVEVVQTAKQAFADLKAHAGNRDQAGWHRWKEIREELE
jgi:hypothetical protein